MHACMDGWMDRRTDGYHVHLFCWLSLPSFWWSTTVTKNKNRGSDILAICAYANLSCAFRFRSASEKSHLILNQFTLPRLDCRLVVCKFGSAVSGVLARPQIGLRSALELRAVSHSHHLARGRQGSPPCRLKTARTAIPEKGISNPNQQRNSG